MAVVFELGGLEIAETFLTDLGETLTEQLALSGSRYIIEVSDVDEEVMQKLNAETRGKAEVTDVLSFPLLPDLQSIQQAPSTETLLGNIVMCSSYALQQKTEPEELLLHGVLHLLGYDHETDLATWRDTEQTSIEKLNALGYNLTGIAKGYL